MAPQGNILTFLGSKELENASLNIADEIFWDTILIPNIFLGGGSLFFYIRTDDVGQNIGYYVPSYSSLVVKFSLCEYMNN